MRTTETTSRLLFHSYLQTGIQSQVYGIMHPPFGIKNCDIPDIMREEVTAAVEFFMRLVETPELQSAIPSLTRTLTRVLASKYKDHWFVDAPDRGQAFRCIEICDNQAADRTLSLAAEECGLSYSELRLPAELCVWVDPHNVACRFGDELGSFLPIFINENGRKSSFIDKFDFTRLCERPHAINNCRSIYSRNGNNYERCSTNRMVGNMVEKMEVEIDRAIPQTNMLTPPNTPPPQSTSPSLLGSPPSPSTRSYGTKGSSSPNHSQGNRNGKYYINSRSNRSSPTSPHPFFSSSPSHGNGNTLRHNNMNSHYTSFFYNNNANVNHINNNNSIYNNNNNNFPSRSPPRVSVPPMGKPSSKWSPFNFPSTTPGSLSQSGTSSGLLHHQFNHHQQNYYHHHRFGNNNERNFWLNHRNLARV